MNVNDLIALAQHTSTLSDLPRTGWLFRGVNPAETVAAHSFGVMAVAIWIAEAFGDVDVAIVAKIALLHDIAEAEVSDIPGPVKREIGPTVDRVEEAIGERIATEAHASWSGYVTRYSAQLCIESQIVKAADKIQMRIQAMHYSNTGRGDVREFLELEAPHFEDPRLKSLINSLWDSTRSLDP